MRIPLDRRLKGLPTSRLRIDVRMHLSDDHYGKRHAEFQNSRDGSRQWNPRLTQAHGPDMSGPG